MKNLIIGMGYVGTITAYSMNKLGHEIIFPPVVVTPS
jgi:UDP-glucose 6-dehydrogenase